MLYTIRHFFSVAQIVCILIEGSVSGKPVFPIMCCAADSHLRGANITDNAILVAVKRPRSFLPIPISSFHSVLILSECLIGIFTYRFGGNSFN